MIRTALISTLAAALTLPGLAGAQADDAGGYEPGDRGNYSESEAQASASAEAAKPEASTSLDDFSVTSVGPWSRRIYWTR